MPDNTGPSPLNDDIRRFSREEIEVILQNAIERQGGAAAGSSLSMNELIETARELDIDPEVIRAAARDHEARAAMQRSRQQYLDQRRKYFVYFSTYIVMSAALITINATLGGVKWSIFLTFTLGVALLFSWLRTTRRTLRLGAGRT